MHDKKASINKLSIEEAMVVAIQIARENHTMFGAVLLNEEGIEIGRAVNTGRADGPTAHAEMNLLRSTTGNGHLPKGTKLVSTCEPCPMCMGALVWSGVDELYYGVSINEAAEFTKQIMIGSTLISKHSFRNIKIEGGICHEECLMLFKERFGK